MKKLVYILSAAIAILSGCTTKEIDAPVIEPVLGSYTLKATIATKTSISDAGELSWILGDQIDVHDGDFEVFSLKNESVGSEAEFTGELYYPEDATFALSPSGIGKSYDSETKVLTLSLPNKYEYDAVNTNAPMIASVAFEDGVATANFTHMAGLIKVSYKNVPANATTFYFEANNTKIAGEFKLNLSETKVISKAATYKSAEKEVIVNLPENHGSDLSFYIPVPVGTFGFTISLYDDQAEEIPASVKSKSSITVDRADYYVLPAIDCYADPNAGKTGWFRVDDVNALSAGDELRIGAYIASSQTSSLVGGFTSDYFLSSKVEFSTDQTEIERVDSENLPFTFTLGGSTGAWTLKVGEDNYDASGASVRQNNDTPNKWTIAINDGKADATKLGQATLKCGGNDPLAFNTGANPKRYKMYGSQSPISIYKKYGNPTDKALRTSCPAEFKIDGEKVSTVNVQLGSESNVFPTLETASTGAKTYSSSNEEAATVDASTGEVTLLTAGTTTISVQIAADENYLAGSASYTLAISPAASAQTDVLDRAFTGVANGATTYSAWSGKVGSYSGNTYAGNSAGGSDAIQLRTSNNNSGIVTTASGSNKFAKKVDVVWNSETTTGRKLVIYGKNTAYSSAADLYSTAEATLGTKLGEIEYGDGKATDITISGDYKYIGIRSNSGALYISSVSIKWEDGKPERNLAFYNGETEVSEAIDVNVGEAFTAPVLKEGSAVATGATYASNNTDVATVDASTGVVTIKKHGTATITATIAGDETYSESKASYTLNVAHVLSGIQILETSTHKTVFEVGESFSFTGIKVNAVYNDECTEDVSSSLTDSNFSGFDSSAAVASQTITVTYGGKTATYAVQIKAAVVKYAITVPAAENGNSVVVKDGSTEAAEGQNVTLHVNLATGYYLVSLKVNDGEELKDNVDASGDVIFTMPGEAAVVTASFDKPVFYESFNTNRGTGGNDGSWSGSIAANTISSDNTGWVFENANGANSCAKFGAGSKLGTATTPALGQACNAKLTFKAAAWNGASESTTLKLSVLGGGTISSATVTLKKAEWTEYEVTLEELTESSKIKFEGNGVSNSRFFLDEVLVVKTGDVATLESVVVSGEPTKKSYYVGDSFEPAGLTVTGVYSDASTKTITDGITWSTPAALALGQTSVSITATVKGVTSSAYVVNGLTVSAPKTLDHISLNTESVSTEFWKGDTFSYSGLVVTAHYSDASTATVTPTSVSTPDMTAAGTKTVTVSYTEGSITKTATYGITVKSIANTQATAYTVSEAIALIDAGKDLATQVYVKGKVSKIVTAYNSSYGNISFNVSEDGTETGNQFQFFRNFKGANKAKWTDSDVKPEVGYEVIGYGTLTKYNSTYEFAEGNYVVSLSSGPFLKATASKTTGIAAAGETVTVSVDTNVEDWTANSDNAAFVISGKTANSFNVVVSANTTTSERTAKITVSVTGVNPVEITLKQAVAGGSYESSGTLASWTFESGTAGTNYPANKTNFANNGSSDLASGTFYLDGTGSTWNSSKGYAFTAVTSVTITVKAAKDLKKGAKITFSMDTYYNKASNAPMTGFTLTAAEGSATASTTGLSATSFSLSTSSATKSVVYTLQNDVAKDGTVKLVLTQTGKAGAGQGFINNVKADYSAE